MKYLFMIFLCIFGEVLYGVERSSILDSHRNRQYQKVILLTNEYSESFKDLDAEVLLYRANAYFELGEYQKSCNDFENVLLHAQFDKDFILFDKYTSFSFYLKSCAKLQKWEKVIYFVDIVLLRNSINLRSYYTDTPLGELYFFRGIAYEALAHDMYSKSVVSSKRALSEADLLLKGPPSVNVFRYPGEAVSKNEARIQMGDSRIIVGEESSLRAILIEKSYEDIRIAAELGYEDAIQWMLYHKKDSVLMHAVQSYYCFIQMKTYNITENRIVVKNKKDYVEFCKDIAVCLAFAEDISCLKAYYLSEKAMVEMQMKKYDIAITDVQSALRLVPKSSYLLYSLGIVLYNAQQYDKAVAVFAQLEDGIAQQSGDVCNIMPDLYVNKLGIKRITISLLPVISPDSKAWYYYYGLSLYACGKKNEAVSKMREASNLLPDAQLWLRKNKLK